VPFAGPNDLNQHSNLAAELIALLLGAWRLRSNLSQATISQLGDIFIGQQILDVIKKYRFNPQDGDVVDECI
jgi:hypothetical protein